jgi:glycine betaine/proline transport system substrate-binding protein
LLLKFKKGIVLLVVLSLLVLTLAGCTQQGQQAEQKKITFGYVNWAEAVAMTHLLQAIIEDEFGYDVDTVQADVGPVFLGVSQGDFDAFVDVWMPVTHESHMAKVGDKIEHYGVVYEGARIGLVVPEYVSINTIEEMNDVKERFGGRIVGIDAGAGIMSSTEKAVEEYGLEYELVASSEPAMVASLRDAIDKEEWVVVTGWSPHWKFARWDLKYLEDSQGVYGEAERIEKIARKGLTEDAPEVANLIKNFTINDDQLGTLSEYINEGMDPVEAGRKWASENADVVEGWLQ